MRRVPERTAAIRITFGARRPIGIIAHADALLAGYAGKLTYNVKPSSPTGQSMTADGSVLESYNKALLTPGCAP